MTLSVLFVCTGNRCRSPIAEGLLRDRVREMGLDVNVGSAGLLEGGVPVEPEAAVAARKLGTDISGHVSRRINPALLDDTDVVLTMERSHAREIAVMHRIALAKTFPLRAVDRHLQIPESAGVRLDQAVMTWSKQRNLVDLMGFSADDDIEDPIGRQQQTFDETAQVLDRLTRRLVRSLA